MNGEILSIETVQKISRLQNEGIEQAKIIFNLNAEINKQQEIITEAYNLLNTNYSAVNDVIEILRDGLNETKRQ